MRPLPLLFCLACTTSSPAAPSPPDAPTTIDAPNPTPSGYTSTQITCQTSTITQTAADNSKIVTDYYFSMVTLDPTTTYLVETCDSKMNGVQFYGVPPACPPGFTCTESGNPYPTASSDKSCYWNSLGFFLDGKIQLSCGYEVRQYNSSGQLTSTSNYKTGKIMLHVKN